MEEHKKAQSETLLTKRVSKVTKDNSFYNTLRNCCVVPRRYIFAIVGAAACFNALAMRLCLNIAITQMVTQRRTEEMKFDPDACPSDVIVGNATFVENIHASFDWDEKTQGLVLSGFYYGYLTTQVYGAHLSEKYGAKWTIGLGLLSTSFFTFLTPLVIRTGGATVFIIHSGTVSCVVPRRYIFAIVGAAACFNALAMRLCLNIAITQMVTQRRTEEMKFDPDACPSDVIVGNATFVENIHASFDWDEKTQGLVLSGFYYGYLTTQVYGAHLSEKYGAKWTIGLGLLSTSFFTFLTPLVIRTGGATGLFILRVLEGMGEGPTMPSLMVMLARWGPPHERAFLSSIIFGGGQLGNIYGSLMSGILLSNGRDWAYVFYFFGASGVLWFVFWVLLCYSEPESHPYISSEELKYLRSHITKKESEDKRDPVPWKAMLLSKPAWALLFANVGHDWGFYTMISDLPKYSHDVLKFNVASTGILTGLPYAAMSACSFIFAAICDFAIKKKWHGIKTARIIYTTIAAAGPAICIILASYCGCNRSIAMVFFIMSMGLMGAYYSGMKVNTLDIAPNYAGSLTSFVNTTSTIGGMITPYLIGLLTPDSTLVQWRTAFWVCFVVLMSTNVVYCVWADGDQQWWDDIRKFGYPSDWKHGPLDREDNDIEAKNAKEMTNLREKETSIEIS